MEMVYWKGTDHGAPWTESITLDLSEDVPEGGAANIVVALRATTPIEQAANDFLGAVQARIGYLRADGNTVWLGPIGAGVYPNAQSDPLSFPVDKLAHDPQRGVPELQLELTRIDDVGAPLSGATGSFTADVRIV